MYPCCLINFPISKLHNKSLLNGVIYLTLSDFVKNNIGSGYGKVVIYFVDNEDITSTVDSCIIENKIVNKDSNIDDINSDIVYGIISVLGNNNATFISKEVVFEDLANDNETIRYTALYIYCSVNVLAMHINKEDC